MKLWGKIIKGSKIVKEKAVEMNDESKPFRDLLEQCFLKLCKELNISVPMWLEKNTNEFARYRRTFFPQDQFVEEVDFDRFELRIEMT